MPGQTTTHMPVFNPPPSLCSRSIVCTCVEVGACSSVLTTLPMCAMCVWPP